MCFFLASIVYFQKLCRVVKTLPLIKLFSLQNDFYETSRTPKNQKTKTFQRMFGLRLMFVFFWFSSSFFLVMTLKKLKKPKVFFDFLDKLMVKDL